MLTVSQFVCQVFVTGFYAVMETTSDPLKISKARNISLTGFDNQGLIATYSTAWVLRVLFEEAALWCTQITANTRNAFPPGGLWRLRGIRETSRRSQSWCGMCQKTGHVPAFCSRAWLHLHTQTHDFRFIQRIVRISVSVTRLTAGTQRNCGAPEKTDKLAILSKTQVTTCVNPTKKDIRCR